MNISSFGGLGRQGAVPCYSSSKHAMVGFGRSLAFLKEEADYRVLM